MREPGFYWVRVRLKWFIAEWKHDRWRETGDWHGFHDSRYDEIIESPVPHPNKSMYARR